jgi:hypothetical protein
VCGSDGAALTAALLGSIDHAVFTAGDTSNDSGSLEDYLSCVDPTWGQYKHLIHPTPGNHDYMTPGAQGYFSYFGSRAGISGQGYYSYDLGTWHIIVLNSNCSEVGGCSPGSPQMTWLQADLEAHNSLCSLSYWHHPRWTSGYHGNTPGVAPFWEALYAAGVEMVLNGHDHDYERFGLMQPDGSLDTLTGIREFVIGTGGAPLRPFSQVQPNSEVRISGKLGILKLMLGEDDYTWQFISAPAGIIEDSGAGTCH